MLAFQRDHFLAATAVDRGNPLGGVTLLDVPALEAMKAIIVTGNPVEGLAFLGLFATYQDAALFGNTDTHETLGICAD